jgi:hypothetical protein
MEEIMIKWLQRIVSSQRSFTVMLNNYSGLPSHTVYARVQDHMPFKAARFFVASDRPVCEE